MRLCFGRKNKTLRAIFRQSSTLALLEVITTWPQHTELVPYSDCSWQSVKRSLGSHAW